MRIRQEAMQLWHMLKLFFLWYNEESSLALSNPHSPPFKLQNEETSKNITHWTLFGHCTSSGLNRATSSPLHLQMCPSSCWETVVKARVMRFPEESYILSFLLSFLMFHAQILSCYLESSIFPVLLAFTWLL